MSDWLRWGLCSAVWGVLAPACALAQPSPLIYDAPAPSQDFVVSYTAQCGGGKPRVDSTETVPSVSSLETDKLKCDWGAIVAGQMSFHAFNKAVSVTLDPYRQYAIPLAPTGDRNVAEGKFGARLDSPVTSKYFFIVWGQALPARLESEDKCPKNGSIQALTTISKQNGLGDVLEARGSCELSAFYIDYTRNNYVRNSTGELISFDTLQTNTVSAELSASDGFGDHMGPGTGAPYIQGKLTLRTVHKFQARPRLEIFGPNYKQPTLRTDSSPSQDRITIRNSGGGAMSWSAQAATSDGGAWLKIVRPEPASGILDPYGVGGKNPEAELAYTIDPSILAPGNYTAVITVTADRAVDSPRKLEIPLTVLAGTNDTIRIVSQTPPASQPLQAGLETDVTVDAAYSLQTKDSGEIVLDVSAAGATTRTARAAVTRGTGTKQLTVEKFAVPAGASSVSASVGLVSGGTRLVQTSTSFPTRAAQDAVQIASGSVRPDPAQPLQAGEESAAEARVQYVLQTKADARLVLGIYPAAQGGTAIASSPPAPVNRTDPANSSKQLATAKFTIPKEAKELYLRAALLDGSDAVISESPAVRFTVNPPPEIGISSIEAVQAVQVAAPGEVPLVLGRPTVVRVFVQQKGRPDKLVAGITGTLQVNAGESSCTVAPRSSVSAHMAPDRNEGSHSLNFPIPASCLGSGGADVPVRYEAKLELEPGNKEIVEFKDNPKEYRSTLQSTVGADAPLRVRYQKVCLKTSSNCPSGSFGGDAGQYIESLLPFQPNGLSLARSSAADAFYPQDLDDADPSRQAVKISAFRMWLRRQYRDLEEAGGDVPDMLIGLVPDILGLPTGEADPAHGKIGGKGRVAFVMDHVSPQRRNYYLAHELGHNLGLRHTNTDDGCPAKAADTETNWPYSNGTINGVGWDHQSHTVIPSSRFDLMTYCVPSSRIWISPFGFNQVFQQLRNWRSAKAFIALPKYSIPNPRPAAAADYLFMAGSVRRDGSAGTLQRGYTAASALPGDEPDAQSRHCLVFSGASGGELSRHCFPLSFDNSETGIPLDENFFEVKVPLPGGAARLDLAVSGRTLAAFPIPAAAPTVSFVSPQPGEKWSGRRTLSWTASDPAGGRLGYKVSYSADDGATWVPLAFDIESTELTVDTGLLAGGARVWFRVQASGGVRTGEGRTGPIEIAVNPVLEPSRDRIEFGAVAPGAVREEALEIRATGSGPVRVTAIRTGSEEFLASAAPLPFTVPAGGSARVAVRFAPRQSGSSSSQLEIESDSPLKPVLSIPLEGGMADAEQPRLVLGDDSIDFGAVPAGGALTLPLELRNAGAAALSGVKLTASPAVFTVQPATVASLAGGATATVNVKFMPVAAGLVEGTLSVGELSVPLRGSGVVSPQPAIELAVRSLDFGDVPAGQRKELNLTVRNRGTATLQVSPLAVNSPVFSFRPATLSVPAGAERELTVIFAPVQTGVQTATLRIGSNDRTNSELTVALRGAGTSTPQPPAADVRMEVTPAALDFGSVPVRGAKDLSLTVRSTGAAPLTVSALAVDNPGFTVASPAAPFTVNFGSSVSVLIRFAPDRVAAFSATLTLRGNATAQPSLTIPLTGAGAAAGPRNEELKADDGSFERMVGSPGWNGDAFWVNRLTPPQYPAKLTQVRIFFPAEGDIAPNTGISLVLGTHPSGTEDVILPRMRPAIGRVSQVGKWVDFDVTLDAIESGDFVVGFYAGVDGGLKPMAQDTSRSAGRSYVSKDGTTYQKAEKAGLDGNFLIRAWVTVGQ